MKILFFGGKGWIGSEFIKYLKTLEDVNIIETNAYAENEYLIKDLILAYSPTHIISIIGKSYDKEDKLYENICDNLYAPLVLSLLAEKNNIHYTYIGTGCIYNNEETLSIKYIESDTPNFYGSSYSIIKGYTDRIMKLNSNTLNLRIRMPINSAIYHKNYIMEIVKLKKNSSKTNSITVLPTIYPIIYDMMKNKLKGTINLTNPDYISNNEILEMYKEIVEEDFKWDTEILETSEINCHLDTTKLTKLYPEIPDIRTGIKKCLIEMKKNLNK